MKFLKPPSYEEGRNSWNAFSIGGGCSVNMTFGSMESSYTYWNGVSWETINSDMDITMQTLEFSGTIGYTYGIGKYFTPEDWKGIVLGLYWKPNFVISSVTTEINGNDYKEDPTSSFNLTGFQWTIDFGSFGALADKLAKEAHFSINGFIIPETDETPFMFSIGIGMVFY